MCDFDWTVGDLGLFGNCMMMSEEALSIKDVKLQLSLYSSCQFSNDRQRAVAWMKQVAIIYNLPRDVRDISVQIFDKYLLQSIEKYPEVIYWGTTIPITAACCLLIGSKVNASRTVLSTESFPLYSKDLLVKQEALILERIDFSILPSVVPSVFIAWLLNFSNDDAMSNNIKLQLKNTADDLVGMLMEWPEYLLYAPSTIAFAALLVAFLHLEIDHSGWLRCVPENVYCTSTSMAFPGLDPSDRMQLLDVGGCLNCFQGLIARSRSHSLQPVPQSPLEAAVAKQLDSEEPRDTDSPFGVADLMETSAAAVIGTPVVDLASTDFKEDEVVGASGTDSGKDGNKFSFRPIF